MDPNASKRAKEESDIPGHPPARERGVEDVDDKRADRKGSNRDGSTGDVELPPNENLRKDADEAYGDTEIPGRKHDV
jgi:hypothetical protein